MLTAGLSLLNRNLLAVSAVSTAKSDALYEKFCCPSDSMRPFVRWWWNGNRLTKDEILRELDVIKAAGLGGVEINPIAFRDKDTLGIPTLEWLSPEWCRMVKIATEGAAERGLICDLLVGTGWPFGGKFLQPEERAKELFAIRRVEKGSAPIKIKISDLEKKEQILHSIWLSSETLTAFDEIIRIDFDRSSDIVEIPVSNNKNVISFLFTGCRIAVDNGAPGGEGPVLNHFDSKSVERYLDRIATKLFTVIGKKPHLRAFFSDSFEMRGHDWFDGFETEFKRRYEYDISPYLPFLAAGKNASYSPVSPFLTGNAEIKLTAYCREELSRVRAEYCNFIMEMFDERFLKTFAGWCHRHGFLSRVQAYGHEQEPLEASLIPDIPECETWFARYGAYNTKRPDNSIDFARYPSYSETNKFVSSAAHLADRSIVSCEEATNMINAFNLTTGQLKIICDQSALSGATHAVFHGFNYSPPEAPFPGWFFCGTYFSEHNPWWKFMPRICDYKARLSSLFQNTVFYADIAVLLPQTDTLAWQGLKSYPHPNISPAWQFRIWEGIHHNGNGCDMTSEKILLKSKIKRGFFQYGRRTYRTLILVEVETLSLKMTKKLHDFAKNDIKIVFVGKEPCKITGLKSFQHGDDQLITDSIRRLKQSFSEVVFNVESPIIESKEETWPAQFDTVAWFRDVQRVCNIKPYMKIEQPSPCISQIRHQSADGRNIFFIANNSDRQTISFTAKFDAIRGVPYVWDAENGLRFPYPISHDRTIVLQIPPSSSFVLVFEPKSFVDAEAMLVVPTTESKGIELKNWQLTLRHCATGDSSNIMVENLFDLSQRNDTRSFAGIIVYEHIFDSGHPDSYRWLDLGVSHSTTEVWVGEEYLGARWFGQHIYLLPKEIDGKKLRIEVTTTVGNYLKSRDELTGDYDWMAQQGWSPTGLTEEVRLLAMP